MGSKTIPILLVTANVGSIFEDPTRMLKVWTEEFLSIVSKAKPKFIALHCQEVGGKNYEKSMKHVENFVNLLMASNELQLFDKIRVFLDEDYSSAENFTALGNLYFVHESIQDVLIYDFKDMKFTSFDGKEIHSGNIEAVVTKEKAKFPQDFFPECKWSRKGFLRTRWSINGTIFDLINIHLFHDASNFVAMEAYPSVYCKNRRRALQHTLQRFHNDPYGKAPYFLFGDFNFRTDTDGVIKKLTEGLTTTRIQNNKSNEYTKLQYSTEDNQLVLTIGKKEFNHSNHQTIFLNPTNSWLKAFDKELEAFEDHLIEFPVIFQPSYPFEEKLSQGARFMTTRCPAWCDRVLLSRSARALVCENEKVEYGLIGRNTCMGDHKPVYLRAVLIGNAGIIKCCTHAPCECLPIMCHCCQLFASVTINVTDMSDYLVNTRKSYDNIPVDSRLLHEPVTRDMLLHEPYTPESAESRSPNPEKIANDVNMERQNSVSPTELKIKLEHILKTDSTSNLTLQRSYSQDVHGVDLSKDFYRNRAMTEIPKKTGRVRLISGNSVESRVRLHSHHSSSDEDWFEFDEDCNSKHTSERSSVMVSQENSEYKVEVDQNVATDLKSNSLELVHNSLKKETGGKLNCCSLL